MKITKEMWKDAHSLSMSIIETIQKDEAHDKKPLLLSLAIAYATFSKVHNVTMHSAIELVMTIYKNTEIIHDDHDL